jgi:hypothetical protein
LYRCSVERDAVTHDVSTDRLFIMDDQLVSPGCPPRGSILDVMQPANESCVTGR